MIDEGTITRALETLLNNATTLSTATIERGTRINFDLGRCPWIGIYPGNVTTTPKTIGGVSASRWLSTAQPMIVVQTASYDGDGTVASDALEALVDAVQTVINADLTLGVSGARVVGVGREYRYVVFDDNESGGLFFPQCIIKIDMEVRSV